MKTKRTIRATKHQYRFGRSTIHITLRRFRTKPQNRSAKYKQHVLRLPGPIQEISYRYSRRGVSTKKVVAQTRRSRAYVPLLLVFVGGMGVGVCATELVIKRSLEPIHSFSTVAIQKPSAKIKVPLTLPASQPTHLSIPSVGIDDDITPVGQALDGSIQMPPILDWVTGWYKYSPTPGQLGPAIIVGHVDTYKGISVFWRLRDVQAGDKIYVSRADGSTATFTVTALKQFSQGDFPTTNVYGNIGYAGLRLITCGGTFSTATGSYDQNTVVYAQLTS